MATGTKFRHQIAAVSMSASLLTFGVVGFTSSGAGATSAPKSIPLQKGNVKFHVSWDARTTGASLSGVLGKFRLSGQITQPNLNATSYVLKGLIDGLGLHVVLVEGVNANAVTITAKGSVGSRTLNATGSIRTTTAGAFTLTFTGRIGTAKISGRFPLSAFTATSLSSVVKIS